MERLGYPPMPWQRYVLDVALELDPETRLPAYREVGLSVPRQQGKTQQLLGVMVHRCMAWQRQNVIYAAQDRNHARKRWEDEFLTTLDLSPLNGRYRTRKTNGNEAIIWRATRSNLGVTSNTTQAGHGPPLDLGVIDEAFAHKDDRLEQAFSPAMVTRDMAQLWWASAGGTEASIWLNAKRKTGRELIEHLWATGEHSATAYFEWFAPDDMRRDDPATWRATMPALGHTITEAVIRAELEKASDDPSGFDRAYLNRTRKAVPPQDPNVPKAKWPALFDPGSQAGPDLALAIDVAPLRDWASIGVASAREDGRIHVELVDRRPGTEWIVPALVRLVDLWDPVAIGIDVPTRSPAGSLLEELAEAGIKPPEEPDKPARGDLMVFHLAEVVSACGQLADAMKRGQLAHIDQVPLTAAVNGARTRPLGDAWAWHRRSAQIDISPLVTATLARYALLARLPLLAEAPYDPVANIG
ncbi:terminase [Streptomyces halstedii]|uniref:terminase n=1 Tax=Streptomyces halstedii TaxID=1944 RepID=UPI00335A48C2